MLSLEECVGADPERGTAGSFAGRWYEEGGPVSTWSGMTRALLRGGRGEVELRNQCPPPPASPEPPEPTEPPQPPGGEGPLAELLLPGVFCRPTAAAPLCELHLETGPATVRQMELSFTVDVLAFAPAGRQQAVACAGDGRYAAGGVPVFIASVGRGRFFWRSGAPGDSAGCGPNSPPTCRVILPRMPFGGPPRQSYRFSISYDSTTGVTAMDWGGPLFTVQERVVPIPVRDGITCWFPFEPGVNPDEHSGIGWTWRDLEWKVYQ